MISTKAFIFVRMIASCSLTVVSPIASLLVEKYLTGQISDKRKPLEERMLNGDLMSRVKTY